MDATRWPTSSESGYDLRWAEYADRILQGVYVPMQQPTRFELVSNFRSGKALDLIATPSRPGRVDEVSAEGVR
jgi:hypothetical protein